MRTMQLAFVASCLLASPLWPEESAWRALDEAALALANRNQLDEARAKAEEAVALATATFGRDDRRTASSLSLLGEIQLARGEQESAETLLREALAIRMRVLEPNDSEIDLGYNQLGRALQAMARHEESEAMFLQAIANAERAAAAGEQGPRAPRWTDLAASLHRLVGYYGSLGDPSRALATAERLVSTLRRYVAGSPETHLAYLADYGRKAISRGDRPYAEVLEREQRRITEMHFGKASIELADLVYGLAIERQATDDPGAGGLFFEALETAERALRPDDPRLAPFALMAGYQLLDSGSPDALARAEKLLRRSHEAYELGEAHDSDERMLALTGLATAYEKLGQPAQAEPLRSRAVALAESLSSPDDLAYWTPLARLDLAANLVEQGKWTDAGTWYQRAYAPRAPDEPGSHQDEHLLRMVETWIRVGQANLAAEAWRQVVALRRSHLAPNDVRLAAAHRDLAALFRSAGQLESAELNEDLAGALEGAPGEPTSAPVVAASAHVQRAFDERLLTTLSLALDEMERQASAPNDVARRVAAIELRAELSLAIGNRDAAVAEYTRAVSLRAGSQGERHQDTLRAAARLAKILSREAE